MNAIKDFLEFDLYNLGEYKIEVYTLVTILLIALVTRFILWLIKKALDRKNKFNKLDKGNTYALFQIIKYVIWVIAIGLILETIGIKVTVLIAGSAALLVGIGLGLQQTFNDVISGIILLSEKSIKIDDVLQIDGDVVKIQSIGLRTSKGLNTDDISIIIPNSLITTNKVINWSHQTKKTRFRIDVGVAYGSDVGLVIKTLEESAFEHPDVTDRELTEARLVNFGNSSLDFQVLFFSKNIYRINKVKSDIRRIINQKFSKNNILIPFPQMDLHFKSNFPEVLNRDGE
ncbi:MULTISPECIES: mechanosensitive ion channel family protein [unclassified Lentimicrobium]|uniref:mechanosensitive ion channel family protein n=1 Tax=unclassified Lentimicrobium TaxID=2677434 RepID=UPI001555610F|nr:MULTISPECIES: mechanosensitive ion channel domain-containing protein [unclassified Lentimicrobium]NPD46971.1 mechanosensitive ion channel [Lentimicrobium sp. S6]NPD84737.1 mechanosensitive ion channel [Lentimicrobium sp. L6]